MDAGGPAHPIKVPSLAVLSLAASRPRDFWTNAEVLQEILYRYMSLNRWAQGKIILAEFATLMRGRIEPVLPGDVELAAALVRVLPGFTARDLVHLAIMQRVGADTLVSADRGFDRAPSVRRLDPADVETWSSQVGR